jgi:hypothetical protein
MKNFTRLFGIIALVAVIGFGMAACEDDSEDTSDALAGTWIAENGMRIVASNGSWTMYPGEGEEGGSMPMRGTYTVSGNNVSITVTHADMGQDGANNWVAYDDLPEEITQYVPKNMSGIINGNKFIANGTMFTKQ